MSKLLKAPPRPVSVGSFRPKLKTSPQSEDGVLTGNEKKRHAFALLPGFYIYLAVLIFARLFTQALMSPLSSVLYIFVIILPFFNLLYLFLCRAFIQVRMGTGYLEGTKYQPIGFEMNIINDSVFPIAFAQADLTVPDKHRVRCNTRRVRMSFIPFGFYNLAENLVFSYRGEYRIGISDVYLFDLFRMFRIRKHFDSYTSIFVLPRRLTLPPTSVHAVADVSTESTENRYGADRAEVSEIRSYQLGDHMKNIHWKLSSKSEELLVKQYSMNSGNTVYLFADLAAVHTGAYDTDAAWVFPDDINEYLADSIVEHTLALVDRVLKNGNRCEVFWFDSRDDGGVCRYPLQTLADADRIFRPLSTAGIVPMSLRVTRLADLVTDFHGSALLFVTGRLDRDNIRDLSTLAASCGSLTPGQLTVWFADPTARIESEAQRERYRNRITQNKSALYSRGIGVETISPDCL